MSTTSIIADVPASNEPTCPAPIRVSCVKRATDTATENFDAKQIIEQIRSDTEVRALITAIREEYWRVMGETNNDREAAKKAIDSLKKRLRAVSWSGTFSRRSQEALIEHSGLLCADLDGLGESISAVRSKLTASVHLWALFTSPTGDGLKAVFRVAADAQKHKASFRAVEHHVRELTGSPIDPACKDVSRLCFLSYDPDASLNEDAVELPPLVDREKPTGAAPAAVGDEKLELRRNIAGELLQDVDWKTSGRGFCSCPGLDQHTTGDGARDCIIYLDKVPTISCVHTSCAEAVENVNHDLRSKIGKAEWEAENRARPTPPEWFNKKFPTLSQHFGEALLVREDKKGNLYVSDISEDFIAATLAERSCPETPTVFLPSEQKFYTYTPNEGIYLHQREPALLTRLSRLLLDCARDSTQLIDTGALKFRLRQSQKLGGVLKKAQSLLAAPDDFFSVGLTEFIPCANGMLRLSDKELLPFGPAYRRRNKLAVAYDPTAKCPLFLDTLMRPALDPDELELLQRWCGLALIGDNLAQRFLILSGTAGGGKGTFVRVLVGIIGLNNVATLRTKLLHERFEVGRFLGKTLLYGADVPEDFLNQRGASVIKSLTGGDPVALEFKRSNETPQILCSFNCLVTCNSRLTVHLEGDTEAWRRRLAIINYRKPKPDKVIADLDKRILEKESSGVLNWMLQGQDKARDDGWQLHLTASQQKIVDDLLLESESHNIFAKEAIFPAPGQHLTVEDCYKGYLRYSADRGWITLPRTKFSQLFADMIARTYALSIRHDIQTPFGEKRGWKGIALQITDEL